MPVTHNEELDDWKNGTSPSSLEFDSIPSSEPSTYGGVTSKPEKMDVTDIIGGYGPWQRNLFVLLFLASIPSSWHNLMMTFMAPPGVDFWCARPPEFQASVSVEKWRNRTATQTGWDQCNLVPYWTNASDEVPIKCTSWEYNTTFYRSTIIDEWNLVCDREWLISLSKSIYNVGYLFAVVIFGQLSDSLGRRPMLLLSYVVNVLAGLLSAFSTSYAMFAVLRFFTAIGGAGFYTISFVLLLEVVSPVNRPMVGISINFGWCLAFISLPAVAWIARDWFWLQLVVTLPKLLFVPVFWLVPESPRWLLIRKENEKFRQLVVKAATKNGRPEEIVQAEVSKLLLHAEKDYISTKSSPEDQKGTTVFDLFKTPKLRKNTLNLFYNWLVNSFIYFGLSYNTDNLAGNLYLNFFASGAVEFPAYLCAIYIIRRLGRRLPLAAGMVAGGVACALTIPIPDNGLFWLKAAFSLLGKFCITATFATVYVYSAEIFPTVVRNVGVGTGSTCARIGSTIAPFVRELETVAGSSVPSAVYAALSVSSGLLVLLLPETNNTAFTDTLEEAENFGRHSRRKDADQDLDLT